MPEPLLAILKLCALALLYLFFLRVLRAVWAEVAPARAGSGGGGGGNGPATAPVRVRKPSRRGKGGDGLVIVEPKEGKGRRFALDEEVTIGRAAGCDITVDDNYAS